MSEGLFTTFSLFKLLKQLKLKLHISAIICRSTSSPILIYLDLEGEGLS